MIELIMQGTLTTDHRGIQTLIIPCPGHPLVGTPYGTSGLFYQNPRITIQIKWDILPRTVGASLEVDDPYDGHTVTLAIYPVDAFDWLWNTARKSSGDFTLQPPYQCVHCTYVEFDPGETQTRDYPGSPCGFICAHADATIRERQNDPRLPHGEWAAPGCPGFSPIMIETCGVCKKPLETPIALWRFPADLQVDSPLIDMPYFCCSPACVSTIKKEFQDEWDKESNNDWGFWKYTEER